MAGARARRWLRIAGAAVGALLLVYAVAVAVLWANQQAVLYPADTGPVSLEGAGLPGFEAVSIRTADGERLVAWWRPPPPGAGVVIYFHGNAGSIAGRAPRLRTIAEQGLGVLGVSYRGYGGSTGRPTEPGLLADGRAAYAWVAERAPAARVALFGESLGSGVAIALAGERQVEGLVLDSPYASVERMGRLMYPWAPVGLLARDRFDSEARVDKVRAPILIVHCTGDSFIPVAEGRRLYRAAREPKDFVAVTGCGHVEAWSRPEARARMLDALRRFTSPPPPRPAPLPGR